MPAGTRCYLCGNPLEEDQDWNRDHVPPRRIFASTVRGQFSPNLEWLATHTSCNSSYREDEEYFVVSFAGHVQTPMANEVMNDLKNAALKGHGVGIIRDVVSRFERVQGPRGERTYSYDNGRTDRFLWKLIRGLYFLHLDCVLPENTIGEIHLVDPKQPPESIERLTWFPVVRDTEPLVVYGRVFDYKWIGWKDGSLRGHAVSMLFWDGLIAASLFHDPTCSCGTCAAHSSPPADARRVVPAGSQFRASITP